MKRKFLIIIALCLAIGFLTQLPGDALSQEGTGTLQAPPTSTLPPPPNSRPTIAPPTATQPLPQPMPQPTALPSTMSPSNPRPDGLPSLTPSPTSTMIGITPTLPPATLPPIQPGWILYNDNDPRLEYSDGGWQQFDVPAATGGTLTATKTAGATLTVQFDGIGIALLYSQGPEGGDFTVQLDDGPPDTASSLAATYTYAQRYQWTNLPAGPHTLTVTNGFNSLWVEAVEVQGTLSSAASGRVLFSAGDIPDQTGFAPVNIDYVEDFDPNTVPGPGQTSATVTVSGNPTSFIGDCVPGLTYDPPAACALFDGPGGSDQPVRVEVELELGSNPLDEHSVTSFIAYPEWGTQISQLLPQHMSEAIMKDELGNILYEYTCIFSTATGQCSSQTTNPAYPYTSLPVDGVRTITFVHQTYGDIDAGGTNFYYVGIDDIYVSTILSQSPTPMPTDTPVPPTATPTPTPVPPTNPPTTCKVNIKANQTIYAFDYPDELKVYLDRHGVRRLIPQTTNVEYAHVIDPNTISQVEGYQAAFTNAHLSEITIDAYYLKREFSIVRAVSAKNVSTSNTQAVDFWFYAGNQAVETDDTLCPPDANDIPGLELIPIYPKRTEAIEILGNYGVVIAEDFTQENGGQQWSDQELREAIISVQRIGTAYEIVVQSGTSREAIFRQKMLTVGVPQIRLLRLASDEPQGSSYHDYYDPNNTRFINNGNCKTYGDGVIACRGTILNGIGEVTEYAFTHEMGHHYDNTIGRQLQVSLAVGGEIIISDCEIDNSTVLGESSGRWTRGGRGWGSLSANDTDISSFQQNPIQYAAPGGSTAQFEAGGDMYLNWVYRVTSDDLPDPIFCDTDNTANNHRIVGNWEGFLNIKREPGDEEPNSIPNYDNRLPGNARYIWMHNKMQNYLLD